MLLRLAPNRPAGVDSPEVAEDGEDLPLRVLQVNQLPGKKSGSAWPVRLNVGDLEPRFRFLEFFFVSAVTLGESAGRAVLIASLYPFACIAGEEATPNLAIEGRDNRASAQVSRPSFFFRLVLKIKNAARRMLR